MNTCLSNFTLTLFNLTDDNKADIANGPTLSGIPSLNIAGTPQVDILDGPLVADTVVDFQGRVYRRTEIVRPEGRVRYVQVSRVTAPEVDD